LHLPQLSREVRYVHLLRLIRRERGRIVKPQQRLRPLPVQCESRTPPPSTDHSEWQTSFDPLPVYGFGTLVQEGPYAWLEYPMRHSLAQNVPGRFTPIRSAALPLSSSLWHRMTLATGRRLWKSLAIPTRTTHSVPVGERLPRQWLW